MFKAGKIRQEIKSLDKSTQNTMVLNVVVDELKNKAVDAIKSMRTLGANTKISQNKL